jgi:capsular exopolysaccharide synthesis family protein
VLLLEADLRRPSIGNKLGISRIPGLTNLLITKGEYREAVQQCDLAPKLDILTSGDIPPNPSELLASNRMARLVEQLKKDYDYIVVDLPPITAVSDALAVSKNLDGVVMVVRAGVSDQQMLAEAMRQLEMVNVPVLGFAYRENSASGQKYGYRYGKKYYKYYNAYEKKK